MAKTLRAQKTEEVNDSVNADVNPEQFALQLYHSGKHAEALEHARPLVENSPNRYDLWNFLGVLYRLVNRLDEAKAAYRKAISLAPEFADTHNNLANVLREQGELEAAVASYKQE